MRSGLRLRPIVARWLLAACLFAAMPAAAKADAASPLGDWLTGTRDGVIHMYACGALLCGRVDGMQYEGDVPRDVWHRSKCQLPIMSDLRPDGQGAYDGHILDPDDGKFYAARVHIAPDGTLKLRGYIAIPLFGQTETWTRYHGPIGRDCHLPSGNL